MLDQKKITGHHLVPYLRNQDVQWGEISASDLPWMDIAPEEFDRYTARDGDLLVCEGGDVGRAAIWRGEPIAYQKALHRLRPRAADSSEFMYYLLVAANVCGIFYESDSKSTISHLPAEAFRTYRFPFPPASEQRLINTALALATARIDALIAKKARFVELLKEKRQALITHAVTKGLDADASMKDSGVNWIGSVPKHWEVRRVAHVYREAIRTGDASLPVLSISIHDGISDEEVDQGDRDRRVWLSEDRTKYKRVEPGDIAYNMMRAWQGAFGAVSVHGLVSPAYVVATPMVPIETAYIEHLLRTPMAIEEMRRHSRGIADFRMRLYWDEFRDLRLCLPPLAEQRQILEHIALSTKRFDAIMAATERSLVLLSERRSALITAAVTGQIDLREVA